MNPGIPPMSARTFRELFRDRGLMEERAEDHDPYDGPDDDGADESEDGDASE